ncbi:DMT family transporter [Paradevosia shaoguanensis]|uniref:DMT family transporter n=1 Tax=Paradevosia shaoguanensis TaxID=1335043 RepID=UPI003C7289A7
MTKPHSADRSGLMSSALDRPYFLLTLTPLFWAGNAVAGKMAVDQVDPYTLIVVRWLAALLLVLPFAWRHLKTDWPEIRKGWLMLTLYGAIGYTGFNVLLYGAAHYTSAVNTSIEQALIPVLVILGNFVIFRVRSTALQLLGVFLTIGGVVLTAVHGDFSRIITLSVNQGDALMILASLSYAAYSLLLRYRPPIHWLSFLVTTFTAALLAGYVAQVMLGGGFTAIVSGVAKTTPLGWAIIAYVAFLPSVVAQLFYARGVELIGANRASLFINLIPVYGTLLSIVILSEPIEPYHMVTAVLVVVGIALAEFSARAPRRATNG